MENEILAHVCQERGARLMFLRSHAATHGIFRAHSMGSGIFPASSFEQSPCHPNIFYFPLTFQLGKTFVRHRHSSPILVLL